MKCVWTDDQEYKELCALLSGCKYQEMEIYQMIESVYRKEGTRSNEGIFIINRKKEELANRILKYDFLTPFLEDPTVNEIMLNGCDRLFVEKENYRLSFEISINEERLYALIQKIVSGVNRTVNLREPIVDARLLDGSRVNVVLRPIAINGPIVTIRKFKTEIANLHRLRDLGCFGDTVLEYLQTLVKLKKNIFVSGSTSSGKTTLLNCLCNEIEKDERVITIEDSAELKLSNIENLVSLETRMIKQNDLPLITMTELIKTSLRMRPDRIIVGEIRGSEAYDMLQALNTGHNGSMSTGHANSGIDMLRRIEMMALAAGISTAESIRAQIGSGIDCVIHLERGVNGLRHVSELIAIKTDEKNGYIGEYIFKDSQLSTERHDDD